MHFGDVSGSLWASCFQEHAETILDGKADELGSLFENEQDQFDAVIKHAAFKSYTTKFRAKLETYNVSPIFIVILKHPSNWMDLKGETKLNLLHYFFTEREQD